MKVVSWNVNGIRSVSNKGFLEWFATESPEIVCLQEIKAQVEQFPSAILDRTDLQREIFSAQKKGYSGVATLSQEKILDTENLGVKEFDDEGRTLIHRFKDFYLFNCYFPNGQRDHNRVPYKLRYCDVVLKKANKLRQKLPVLIVGDFNTAHTENDLANPKSNVNTTGFLPIERAWMDKLLECGWIDLYRHFYPSKNGAYTWWTYRGDCRERNIGWRIDYAVASPELLPFVKKVGHSPDVMGSDHCPVWVDLKFKR